MPLGTGPDKRFEVVIHLTPFAHSPHRRTPGHRESGIVPEDTPRNGVRHLVKPCGRRYKWMTAPWQRGPSSSNGAHPMINVLKLETGATLRLSGDATAEVVSNPRDGIWIRVRYLTSPGDPERVGTEELVFAEDVLERV